MGKIIEIIFPRLILTTFPQKTLVGFAVGELPACYSQKKQDFPEKTSTQSFNFGVPRINFRGVCVFKKKSGPKMDGL